VVDVLALSLSQRDYAALHRACTECGLRLHHGDALPANPDELAALAVFCGPMDEAGPSVALTELRAGGTHLIAVLPERSAESVLAAIKQGFALVLDSPLLTARVSHCLRYLLTVAPPRAAQTVRLGRSGELRALNARSVQLSRAEAVLLRALGKQPGHIVHRTEAARLTGEDPSPLIRRLSAKLADIDSRVKILKVPHVGYRMVGTLALDDNGRAIP
jgi:DNA-binding response OmpR family regulator